MNKGDSYRYRLNSREKLILVFKIKHFKEEKEYYGKIYWRIIFQQKIR